MIVDFAGIVISEAKTANICSNNALRRKKKVHDAQMENHNPSENVSRLKRVPQGGSNVLPRKWRSKITKPEPNKKYKT